MHVWVTTFRRNSCQRASTCHSITDHASRPIANLIYLSIVCRKGFKEATQKGAQIGHPVQGMRVVLTDGQAHSVDSSEMAFKLAAQYAFRQSFLEARPAILEPVMSVEVMLPHEFQGIGISLLNKRKGQLTVRASCVPATAVVGGMCLIWRVCNAGNGGSRYGCRRASRRATISDVWLLDGLAISYTG
jgi:translation elongation factor EF-G